MAWDGHGGDFMCLTNLDSKHYKQNQKIEHVSSTYLVQLFLLMH